MANTYNGWTNYETWAANLYYGDGFEDVAEDYRDNASDFAEYLKEIAEEHLPEVRGLAADLLNAAFSEINWYEIATNILEDLPELEEEEEEEEEEEDAI